MLLWSFLFAVLSLSLSAEADGVKCFSCESCQAGKTPPILGNCTACVLKVTSKKSEKLIVRECVNYNYTDIGCQQNGTDTVVCYCKNDLCNMKIQLSEATTAISSPVIKTETSSNSTLSTPLMVKMANASGSNSSAPETTESASGSNSNAPETTESESGSNSSAPETTESESGSNSSAPEATESASGSNSSAPVTTESASGSNSSAPETTESASGSNSSAPETTESASGSNSSAPETTESASGSNSSAPETTESASGSNSSAPETTESASGSNSSAPETTESATGSNSSAPETTESASGSNTRAFKPIKLRQHNSKGSSHGTVLTDFICIAFSIVSQKLLFNIIL